MVENIWATIPEVIAPAHRVYRCSCCGHKKAINTNHRVSCLDHCPGCSWKAYWKGGENSFATPLHLHCRVFNYVSDDMNKVEG